MTSFVGLAGSVLLPRFLQIVIPAQAGIQWGTVRNTSWIPACAGMTFGSWVTAYEYYPYS
jgi:hypothetical protein